MAGYKRKYLFRILACIFVLFVFTLVAYLFYMQNFHYDDLHYVSDFPAHYNSAVTNKASKSYSLNGFIIYFLYMISNTKMSMVVWLLFLIASTYIVNLYIINLFFKKNMIVCDIASKMIFSLVPLFMTSIYLPHFYEKIYAARAFGGSLWHNETYFEMRLMSMIVLLFFFWLKGHYLEKLKIWEWIVFTLLLTITNAFKPNFVFGFAPMVAIILLIDLVKNIKDRKKIIRIICMGLAVICSLFVLIFQSSRLFDFGEGENSGNGIGIEIGKFLIDGNIYWKFILGLLFVTCILIYSIYKKNVPNWYKFLLGIGIVNLLIFSVFVETGTRYNDGNFGWGFRNSMYLLNGSSFLLLLKYAKELLENKNEYFGAMKSHFRKSGNQMSGQRKSF